jgi:hypothetical protein
MHGNPFGGRTPNGEPMAFYRHVVLLHDADECLPWPYANDGKGYGVVWVDGSIEYVSRLVCEAVHGPPPTPDHEAAHGCGKGHLACVAKRHLTWKTHAENMEDKFAHGTILRGEQVGNAKITADQAASVKRAVGVDASAMADRLGVSKATIYSIRRGENWGWISV